ncbi:hypothetical protein LguiB_018799 [Lonicera macranthoides]
MEKRKKTRPPSIANDLAIVKAAAWAWYQRGSGSDGRPMTEHDFTRSHRAYVPSRYKLEAMKRTCQESTTKGSHSSPSLLSSPSYTDNSLFDHYEIERISRELDYYMESSGSQRSHRREAAWPEREKSGKKKSKSGNSKKKSGFWSMRGGVVCGSKDDVVASYGHRSM